MWHVLFRRDEGPDFAAVSRPMNSDPGLVHGGLPPMSVDGRMLPVDTHAALATVCLSPFVYLFRLWQPNYV